MALTYSPRFAGDPKAASHYNIESRFSLFYFPWRMYDGLESSSIMATFNQTERCNTRHALMAIEGGDPAQARPG